MAINFTDNKKSFIQLQLYTLLERILSANEVSIDRAIPQY